MMSEAFDWSSLKPYPYAVELDDYLTMPEDIASVIEVKDGMIVHCESPSPNHNAVARNLERALLDGRAKRGDSQPCLRINRDVDMLVSEVPLHYKRPDVIVYRCIDEPRGKWKLKPTVTDAVLVIEIVSPSTVTADLIDKRAEYARFGIQYYWIVRMVDNDGPVVSIEMLTLDSEGKYASYGHRTRANPLAIETVAPFGIQATWDDLDEDVD